MKKLLLFLLLLFFSSCSTSTHITMSNNDEYNIVKTSEHIYVVKKGEYIRIIVIR